MTWLKQYIESDGVRVYQCDRKHYYVGVTSAIGELYRYLNRTDRPNYYGPFAKLHAQEGTWCHEVCLDWLAKEKGWIDHYELPVWNPDLHPDESRMRNVLHAALTAFQEFCEQHEVEALAIEAEGSSLACHLVGHIDLVCRLKWKGRRVKAVIDLKFVDSIQPAHEIQVRCYYRFVSDAQIGLLFHQNRNDGTWKLHFVDLNKGREDVQAVSNIASVYTYNIQRNLV
jgi:hypothetical protein